MIKHLGSILAVAFLLLAVAPAGAPAQLTYVYSDSMEPTIGTNDGFLVVATDSVEPGDVVTFRSPIRDSYVTHRVVDTSPDGYVTKGDNNPTTDQAAGHPPVDRAAIVGEVVTVGGEPLTIPGYGVAVTTVRGSLGALLAALGLLALGSALRASPRPSARRSVPTVRDVLLPLAAVCVLTATGLVLVGGTTHQFGFVAVENPATGPTTLTVGESETTTLHVNRSGSPFTHVVVGTDDMRLTNRTRNATHVTVTARVPPPETTGAYSTNLRVHTYPAVLPLGVLQRLDRIHPVVPASLTTLPLVLPPVLGALFVLDGRTPIRPSRSRWRHRVGEVFE